MILKDATPYNIQWHKGKLLFIDTLSFEKYKEVPWIGYRQFCENFLGPLLIMHYSKTPLPQLFQAWPDGIPVGIIKSLLPKRSRFSLHTYLHIHLHAKIASKKQDNNDPVKPFPKQKLLNLISSLEILITQLKVNDQNSTWSGYYEEASQRDSYLEDKKKIIDQWLQELHPVVKTAVDLGANEGEFSKLLAEKNISAIAADFDPFCINRLYRSIQKKGEQKIQPLVMDLSKPSPAIGVNNLERNSFIGRSSFDLVMALALIHHMVIGKSIPFEKVAELFSQLGQYLVSEFVPTEDKKTQQLLQTKKDVYIDYSLQTFLNKFSAFYSVLQEKEIAGSGRILFLMKKN